MRKQLLAGGKPHAAATLLIRFVQASHHHSFINYRMPYVIAFEQTTTTHSLPERTKEFVSFLPYCVLRRTIVSLLNCPNSSREFYIFETGERATTIAQRLAIDTKHDGNDRRSLGSHPSCP